VSGTSKLPTIAHHGPAPTPGKGIAHHRQLFGRTRVIYRRFQRNVRNLNHVEPHAASSASQSEPERLGGSDPEVSKGKSVKHEHHANSGEEGETANIKQNTTNKGFFRGRRLG